jgi:DNA-binding CsgD family transcriptional regulator
MITAKEYRAALDLVHTMNAADTPTDLVVLNGLQRLVGAESVSVNVIDHRQRRLMSTAIQDPQFDLSADPDLHRHIGDHPGFVAYLTGRIRQGHLLAVSDITEERALRKHPLFATCYRRVGVRDQLLAYPHIGPRQGAVVVFNRTRRGVSARDRQAAELLLPHLSLAMRQHRERQAHRAAVSGARAGWGALEDAASRLPSLTRREREVTSFVGHGATDRQIARWLGTSERTVHKHLENVYRKLGINGRTQLLALTYGPPAAAPSGEGPEVDSP